MVLLAPSAHASRGQMGRGIPFLRCSFSWLSSPWAASWWMDKARGQRDTVLTSVPPFIPCPKLPLSAPAIPLPLPPLGTGAHSQSRVAGRAETSFPRCRLVRVVECFRELPAGTEGKGLSFLSGYVSVAAGGWSHQRQCLTPLTPGAHSALLDTQVHLLLCTLQCSRKTRQSL